MILDVGVIATYSVVRLRKKKRNAHVSIFFGLNKSNEGWIKLVLNLNYPEMCRETLNGDINVVSPLLIFCSHRVLSDKRITKTLMKDPQLD